MEPMTLGSPSGSPSPASGTSSYLPPFLMGEANISTMPRNNTLSPTKGRALAFGHSPGSIPQSPEFNRSNFQQKSFLGYQHSPSHSYAAPSNNNKSISGPPTQSLFDSLYAEKISMQPVTPTRSYNPNNQSHIQNVQQVMSPLANQSYIYNQSINESYLSHSNYASPRISSPVTNNDIRSQSMFNVSNCVSPLYSDFWITVYGFPPTATSMIISHFSQCGNIVDKTFPPQNGNWIHLKYSSRLECDKALNYNEKILSNSLMIGVTRCKDPYVIDKENLENDTSINRVRPLAHAGYKSVQHQTEVVPGLTAPKKSTGLVNKAMDLFFGW